MLSTQADLIFSSCSLDAPLSGRADAGQVADLLGEDDQAVEHAIDMEAVNAHLDELPEREQRILIFRFTGTSPRTRSPGAWASPRCTYPGCSLTRWLISGPS